MNLKEGDRYSDAIRDVTDESVAHKRDKIVNNQLWNSLEVKANTSHYLY